MNYDDLKDMDKKVKEEVLHAADKARDMNLPDANTLHEDVYDNFKGLNQ